MNPAFEVGKKDLPESLKNNLSKINYTINNNI